MHARIPGNYGLTALLAIAFLSLSMNCISGERDIYQLKIYTIESETQEQRMDSYLKDAYIPALHRAGIKHVGVFKPVEDSELTGQRIFVLIPFQSIQQFEGLGKVLKKDATFQSEGSDYINASHDDSPYVRIESVLLRAFKSMPNYGIPTHTTDPSEQIYELRSYQGATEKLYEKKVDMFDDGGESKLFIDLGFQPILFGEVISGSDMPNLMYLTTFENSASQEKLWNSFRNSPEWGALKADPQYKNTVSSIDKFLLHPTEYSDL